MVTLELSLSGMGRILAKNYSQVLEGFIRAIGALGNAIEKAFFIIVRLIWIAC